MAVPDRVVELVNRFRDNEVVYRSPSYKEAHIRQDFIDPMFLALGWDLRNEQNAAETYKEVIFEDAIKVGGSMKAPDYCFRIGGNRKFFVEAKKPSVNLADSVSAAYQVRRYGWSAKLPVSILTDFEELAVYDCRVMPNKDDKSTTARSQYLQYTQYADHWDDIYSLFSKEAVLAGSLDQFAEAHKTKRGATTVDAAFLKEIESWREKLAIAISLQNPELKQRELNFAVQMTINRVIFLRICEDRGIEPYGQLSALTQHEQVYEELCRLFQQADARYNSGLFHFHAEKGRLDPDEFTLGLAIADEPLRRIIGGLYYPDSPYEFSVMPIEILGQVYEQFLGKVIRLTADHEAVVEDKPEVKKAGGVYYTPTYIVDYIVENTVGRLLEGKTPKQAEKIRVLDPACGSGSFLIGAYRFLLDWYLEKYVADPTKHKKKLYIGAGGGWLMTSEEKKQILLNHIYGVDIDLQAVETTKLSLLLKVLEGESQETVSQQLKLLQERALPDLENNIKCGNSLIGSDYYDSGQMSLLDEEEVYRINVFDWKEGFPEIMKSGGFDAVIGNPPYVRQEILGQKFKTYAKEHFETYACAADLYVYFFEQSHRVLKTDGYFSMICSNKFMRSNYGEELRNFLTLKTKLVQIIDFGELPVFQNAATFPAIFITQNNNTVEQEFTYAPIKNLKFQALAEEVSVVGTELNSSSLSGGSWTLARSEEVKILEKLKRLGTPLGKYTNQKIYWGIKTGLNEAFVINSETRDELVAQDPKSAAFIKPFVLGDDVRKYRINPRDRYLILIPKGWTRQNSILGSEWEWFQANYPALANHLLSFATAAIKRCDQGDYWWELRACDYYAELEKPKIIYPDIAKESRIAFDSEGLYIGNTLYFIPTNDFYLLGLLNSKLIFMYYKRTASVLGDADKGGRLRWFRQDVLKLPIRAINFSNSIDKEKHDRIVSLVEQMLSLHKRLADAKMASDKKAIEQQIKVSDRQIDQLVYELYELTEEEIAIVEGKHG